MKLPPPFFVRLSQIAWVLSLVAGGVAIAYLFVIRQAQLPVDRRPGRGPSTAPAPT